MSDQALGTQQPDLTGINRAPDGTILEPGTKQPAQTTKPEGTTTDEPTTKSDGTSLLNQDDKTKTEVTGAPEKYADFTLPEGLKADPEKMTAATALFKELNLPQEGAQKLVDFYAAELTAAAEAPINAYLEQRKEWQREVAADPEIGGKLKEVRTTIGRAISTLGPLEKDFRSAMDLTGAGDHPGFVKAMYKFAQQLTEGRHVAGSGPSVHGQHRPGAPTGTGAGAMYPNLPSAGR